MGTRCLALKLDVQEVEYNVLMSCVVAVMDFIVKVQEFRPGRLTAGEHI